MRTLKAPRGKIIVVPLELDPKTSLLVWEAPEKTYKYRVVSVGANALMSLEQRKRVRKVFERAIKKAELLDSDRGAHLTSKKKMEEAIGKSPGLADHPGDTWKEGIAPPLKAGDTIIADRWSEVDSYVFDGQQYVTMEIHRVHGIVVDE